VLVGRAAQCDAGGVHVDDAVAQDAIAESAASQVAFEAPPRDGRWMWSPTKAYAHSRSREGAEELHVVEFLHSFGFCALGRLASAVSAMACRSPWW
jgi:hypothetical protein